MYERRWLWRLTYEPNSGDRKRIACPKVLQNGQSPILVSATKGSLAKVDERWPTNDNTCRAYAKVVHEKNCIFSGRTCCDSFSTWPSMTSRPPPGITSQTNWRCHESASRKRRKIIYKISNLNRFSIQFYRFSIFQTQLCLQSDNALAHHFMRQSASRCVRPD